jgi:hypothetical protein
MMSFLTYITGFFMNFELLYFILTILITEDDHNHIFFLTIATQLFFFIAYNKMKKYISHCRNSSNIQ